MAVIICDYKVRINKGKYFNSISLFSKLSNYIKLLMFAIKIVYKL